MEQLNRIELRGSVGNVRIQTVSDKRMARFNVATNYAYKDRNNNPVIETTWHPVIMWEGKSDLDFDKIEKGAKVYVQGRVRIQKYTGADSVDRISYEVIAGRVSLLDDKDNLQCEF